MILTGKFPFHPAAESLEVGIPVMNCPDCGNPVEKDAKFCPKCYARIEPPGLGQKILAQFQNASQPPPPIISPKSTDEISWKGKKVRVRARLVPRFLWTTSSIDVYLDGECAFRTGGKLAVIGSHSAAFRGAGSEHRMELSWGRSRNFFFPYQLRIDGVMVDEARVQVENSQMMLIPALIIVALMFLSVVGLNLLFKSGLRHITGN